MCKAKPTETLLNTVKDNLPIQTQKLQEVSWNNVSMRHLAHLEYKRTYANFEGDTSSN